jgi:hypothetical protein
MGFEIDRLRDHGGYNVGISGYLGNPEKRRCLTREIVPAEHCIFPNIHNWETPRANPDLVPKEKYRSELKGLFG